MTDVIICDKSVLVREGVRSILTSEGSFRVVGECSCFEELNGQMLFLHPRVLVLDPASVSVSQIKSIAANFNTSILCVSEPANSSSIKEYLSTGISCFIFKDCDRKEILDAAIAASSGEKFFCGKAIEALTSETQSPVNCLPVKVSAREAEIIRLIAEGLTNKEIAERLCLSGHTITTHRKNIMGKLGLTSTAGLVMFAIRENIIQPE